MPNDGDAETRGPAAADMTVRRLTGEDAAPYRELRLLALQLHPDAFGASLEEEEAMPADAFASRLTDGTVFGAWSGDRLVGCAGLARREKTKLRHKAVIWGMFVRHEMRGQGVGQSLLDMAIAEARLSCEEVLLTVVASNAAAVALYTRAGFSEYGREPAAIKIGTDYHDEILMRLPFDEDASYPA